MPASESGPVDSAEGQCMMSDNETEGMHDEIATAFDAAAEAEDKDPPITETPDEVPAVDAPPILEVVGDVVADEPKPDAQEEVHAFNAPQSWGVAEREGWASIDPSIQAQIDKREKEISNTLTTTKEARDFHQQFNETVTPFQHFIQAEGATPIQAVGNLLQTAATLQGGSQHQKAERIAQLISHYGIDIRTLDSLLAGETPDNPQQQQFGDMLDQRLGPINQFMQQQQTFQQQQYSDQQTAVSNELTAFYDTHEFATDLKSEMADMMEMAGRRNESLTLDQAYERAIAFRPDIQTVVDQRKAAAAAQANNQQIQQKQAAAVSVGQGNAPLGDGKPPAQSMRQAILEAMGDT